MRYACRPYYCVGLCTDAGPPRAPLPNRFGVYSCRLGTLSLGPSAWRRGGPGAAPWRSRPSCRPSSNWAAAAASSPKSRRSRSRQQRARLRLRRPIPSATLLWVACRSCRRAAPPRLQPAAQGTCRVARSMCRPGSRSFLIRSLTAIPPPMRPPHPRAAGPPPGRPRLRRGSNSRTPVLRTRQMIGDTQGSPLAAALAGARHRRNGGRLLPQERARRCVWGCGVCVCARARKCMHASFPFVCFFWGGLLGRPCAAAGTPPTGRRTGFSPTGRVHEQLAAQRGKRSGGH